MLLSQSVSMVSVPAIHLPSHCPKDT